MTRYDAVFFDSGGTLFDAKCREPSIEEMSAGRMERLSRGLKEYGVEVNKGELTQIHDELMGKLKKELGAGFSYYELIMEIIHRKSLPVLHEEAGVLTCLYTGTRYRHWLFPGVPEMFDAIKEAGVFIGLIANTDWPCFAMQMAFKSAGISGYFDTWTISCDEAVRKPEAAIFAAAQRKSGLNTPGRRILYVGDDVAADIEGAKRYGWDAALRRSKTKTSGGLADFEFDESGELAGFVLG